MSNKFFVIKILFRDLRSFIWFLSALFLYEILQIIYQKTQTRKTIQFRQYQYYLFFSLLQKLFCRLVLFTQENHVESETGATTVRKEFKQTQTREILWSTENQSALGGLNPNLNSSWQTGGKHSSTVWFLYQRQSRPSHLLRHLI